MLKRWRVARGEALVIAIMVALTGFLFGIAVYRMIYDVPGSDYTVHVYYAHALTAGQFSTSHILFQLVIIGLATILPISFEVAGLITGILFYVFAVVILYALIRAVVDAKSLRGWLLVAGSAMALLFVMPINLLTLAEHHLYFGYIGINVLHNPTIVVLKPTALLLFVFAMAVITQSIRLNLGTFILGIFLCVLSAFAKPSYVLDLLPVLLLVAAYRLVQRNFANVLALGLTLIVPIVICLAVQYQITYVLINDDTGIIFAPLASLYYWVPSYPDLAIRFVMSIVFPVVAYVLYFRQALRDRILNLAWLVFFSGAGQTYLLAESGPRLSFGNLWWSGQIALFLLFTVTTVFCLRHFQDRPRWRAWVCVAVFLLCLVSGVIYYATQVQPQSSMFDWW
ncbi:MAG TPA: hypothetical protein VHD90_01380 [Phototrophicaceae bacterium]|nr:hypothetical protein [Phototrophicaceae bacterium]